MGRSVSGGARKTHEELVKAQHGLTEGDNPLGNFIHFVIVVRVAQLLEPISLWY